jgi:acrylyl-CoA reductase (NADPH)
MDTYRAFVARRDADSESAVVEEMEMTPPAADEVQIKVEWSSVNFKDALAASKTARVARISPLVPGIDLAGVIVDSSTPGLPTGTRVLAHGYDLGVARHGGFAEFANVPAHWVVPLPDSMSARAAMVIGTAGYTAALSVVALEDAGLTPDTGEVLVLGASGGVGSMAVSILASRGYQVVAVTGKPESAGWLAGLGAARVMQRDEVTQDGKPMERELWAGCVDAVGGKPLEYAIRTLRYGAAVASCGQVASAELHTSIFPFILRGISHLGVDSVQTPIDRRRAVWQRLAGDLEPKNFQDAVHEIDLDGLPAVLATTLAGGGSGRTVVRVSPSSAASQ